MKLYYYYLEQVEKVGTFDLKPISAYYQIEVFFKDTPVFDFIVSDNETIPQVSQKINSNNPKLTIKTLSDKYVEAAYNERTIRDFIKNKEISLNKDYHVIFSDDLESSDYKYKITLHKQEKDLIYTKPVFTKQEIDVKSHQLSLQNNVSDLSTLIHHDGITVQTTDPSYNKPIKKIFDPDKIEYQINYNPANKRYKYYLTSIIPVKP